ncbi:MAG: T9SS type A sorting domain-containing protein [Bacteroidales bacterium]|nr:T9SS type A sorting domain-containing protein [Lentimicrobiaceae bacterium]MDD5693771.1 T9SS type A sorting domain-containing protein [Bacteroidales bacterium]
MKKVLLFSLVMCLSWAAIAQTGTTKHLYKPDPYIGKANYKTILAPEKESMAPVAVTEPVATRSTVAGRSLTFVPMGQSGNAFGFYNAPRTSLWVDPRINSVTLTHRAITEPDTYSTARIAYDVSWNGGNSGSWTNNLVVYEPLGPAPTGQAYPLASGRYPQGAIFNPPGNTDPDNAYYTYFIPTIDYSNSCDGTWGGLAHGVNGLTACYPPAPTQTNYSSDSEWQNSVPSAFFVTLDGQMWFADPNETVCEGTGSVTDGNVQIWHGQWNAEENDIVYERELVEVMSEGDAVNHTAIAFGPDNLTGYILIMTPSEGNPQDYNNYHPLLIKTTDGGQTWEDPVHVLLGGYDGIDAIKGEGFIADTALLNTEDYAEGFDRDTVWYYMGWASGLAVDAYGNPHMTGLVILAAPGGIYGYPEYWATFHIYSEDGGETFDAKLLYRNKTWQGDVGGASGNAIGQNNRPYIASDITGKYLFFSCVDTDWESLEDNTNPDIFVCSFDVVKKEYTEMENVTVGTQAWVAAFDGSMSHWVPSEVDGNVITCMVPFAYQELGKTELGELDAALQVQFWYIKGWEYEFIAPIGMDESTPIMTSVSQNFPNPFSKTSEVFITLQESTTLSMEVFNLMGQKVYTQDLGSVSAGQHRMTIDASNLGSGVYFYTVKAGDENITKKMIVE